MPQIGRFINKQNDMREYVKILDDFVNDQNYQRLGARVRMWSIKNNRNPKMIYRYQRKIMNLKR